MKVKNLKSKKQLLMSLTLKKFQVYKNSLFYKLELKFKQSLQIISNYHLKKRKILFIGLPYKNNQLVFKSSKHIFVTKELLHAYLNPKDKLKNISLIVFFNFQLKDFNLLKELKGIKKAIIVIGQTFSIKNKSLSDYNVDFNLKKVNLKQFCSFLIYSILKKN